jgi:hypothetical protein
MRLGSAQIEQAETSGQLASLLIKIDETPVYSWTVTEGSSST